MGYRLYIPADDAAAEQVVRNWVSEGERLRNPQAVKWWLAHFYMRGIRNFKSLDYQNGRVTISYLDEQGELKFQYEEILSKYQTQMGRLMGLNLEPATKPKGISLDGLRKAGTAQMCLDAAFPDSKVLKMKTELLPELLMYGTVGLAPWVEGPDSIGVEIIPPWELLPVPADVPVSSGVRAVMRARYVPKKWVEELITTRKLSKKLKEVDSIQVPSGQIPSGASGRFQGGFAYYGTPLSSGTSQKTTGREAGGGDSKDETTMEVVKFVELWTYTSDDFLADYQFYAGGANSLTRLFHRDFSNDKICMPLNVIRDIDIGGFYGRAYIDTLIPINAEMEYTIGRVFQNIQEFDLLGLMMWPMTLGTPAGAIREHNGVKFAAYEVDYTCPDQKPFQVQPANSGMLPAQALKIGMEIMDRTANQPSELLKGEAPGRVDSSAGIGMLYEVSGIPLHPTAKSIAVGLGNTYRAMLGMVGKIWADTKVIEVTRLDDSLAGIKFDSSTGTVTLASNSIPHPDDIILTVASEIPKSDEQQKAELKEALQAGIITLTEYRIEVRKRGLTSPVGNEVEWQNYRKAMLENLLLFNDGKEPNIDSVIMAAREMHLIHLMVLESFMARPEFMLASTAVRTAFENHRDKHRMALGELPEGMPNIEDAAAESMGQQIMPAGMGGDMMGGMMPNM